MVVAHICVLMLGIFFLSLPLCDPKSEDFPGVVSCSSEVRCWLWEWGSQQAASLVNAGG